MNSDLRVQLRLFGGVAAFIALLTVVYWFASYERAGTTMLALSSALVLLCASYLYVQERRHPVSAAEPTEATPEAQQYLPESSIWPFGIGLGALLTLNGIIVGWGYGIPGLAVLLASVAGFVAQSRRRD
jgi:uncharacterized membrane protein YkgB